jgi:cytidyltransferase-like protein
MVNLERATLPIVSGGFDPLHNGHINMIEAAYNLRGFTYGIVVLLNSDDWLTRKKGKPFMSFAERKHILKSLAAVKDVIEFDDSDDTCIDGLEKVKKKYPQTQLLFCNGGDRTEDNIPESDVEGITCLFGIGGEKSNSSSELTSEQRVWGSYQVLYEQVGCKVKELVIAPDSGISYQRHEHRAELWFVREGCVNVKYHTEGEVATHRKQLSKNDTFTVEQNMWHQLYNTSESNCYIIEIQYGEQTDESDIERLSHYSPHHL